MFVGASTWMTSRPSLGLLLRASITRCNVEAPPGPCCGAHRLEHHRSGGDYGKKPLVRTSCTDRWPTCSMGWWCRLKCREIGQLRSPQAATSLWARWLRVPCRRWQVHYESRQVPNWTRGPSVLLLSLCRSSSQKRTARRSYGQNLTTCGIRVAAHAHLDDELRRSDLGDEEGDEWWGACLRKINPARSCLRNVNRLTRSRRSIGLQLRIRRELR